MHISSCATATALFFQFKGNPSSYVIVNYRWPSHILGSIPGSILCPDVIGTALDEPKSGGSGELEGHALVSGKTVSIIIDFIWKYQFPSPDSKVCALFPDPCSYC